MPIGQRDQSAAALPIFGGCSLPFTTTRFPPTTFTVRVVVVVIVVVARVAFRTAGFGSSSLIEKGCEGGV